VCPRIAAEPIGRPQLFNSEEEAKDFLARPVPNFVGSSDLQQQKTDTRVHVTSPSAEPIALPSEPHTSSKRDVTNRDQGWGDPVRIRRFGEYAGPRCDRSIRDLLPLDRLVGEEIVLSIHEQVKRALRGATARYTCYLAEDWLFPEIEQSAWKLPGHLFKGKRYDTVTQIVVPALYDLEDSFVNFHPDAPCVALADFWSAWQVWQHLAEFCFDMESAHVFAQCRAITTAKQIEAAVWTHLAAFAHDLRVQASISRARDSGTTSFVITDGTPALEAEHEVLERVDPAKCERVPPDDRRRLIGQFLESCNTHQGRPRVMKDDWVESRPLTITETHIWKVAGYRRPGTFQYWKRGKDRPQGSRDRHGAGPKATLRICTVLRKSPEAFFEELKRVLARRNEAPRWVD
jgi:hypothetical protein